MKKNNAMEFLGCLTLIFFLPYVVEANQLISNTNNIKSNMILLAQAVAGIGFVVGIIIWNSGNAPMGKEITKTSGVGIVLSFILPSIISYLQVLGG